MQGSQSISQIRPVLKHRACGGWLATAPAGSIFSMGVTAPSETEARERFYSTVSQWAETLEMKEAAN